MLKAYCEPILSNVLALSGAPHKADGLARPVTVSDHIECPVVASLTALCLNASTLQMMPPTVFRVFRSHIVYTCNAMQLRWCCLE